MPFSVNDIDDFLKLSRVFRRNFAPIQDFNSRLRSNADQAVSPTPVWPGQSGASMKIEPNREPLAEQAAQQEGITTEFEAGTEPRVLRRTTVTVERETISVLMRRAAAGPQNQPAPRESAAEPLDKNLPASPIIGTE